jgi:predicted unusual protein kinase regulating ubiquinone biosynthesis (AarF/ABC1/UbiB family)
MLESVGEMSDSDDARRVRRLVAGRLRGAEAELSTSALGRIVQTAFSAFKARRLLRRGDDEADLDALVKLVSSVGELKGIAMKAGQLLSYVDLPLPPQLQGALSVTRGHSVNYSRPRET